MMVGYISSVGLPLPQLALALALAIIVEIGGSLALIAGYRTRTVAAVLAAVSYTHLTLPTNREV